MELLGVMAHGGNMSLFQNFVQELWLVSRLFRYRHATKPGSKRARYMGWFQR